MTTSQTSEVLQHLRRAVLLRDGAGLTDGQLLADYLGRRDEAALAALVRRHGPMVWGVCRRVLRNHHDAEDAFQATFLVLVRKAASVVPKEMVANWLYGVAHQTALKARATTARRRTRERQVTQMPEPAVTEPDLWHDLQPLLDQELSRLPDKYRVALVLCDLDGKTRKEAARQLGVPEGTVAARLARGRVLLAKRLARHGLAVSGGSLAALLAQNAASASAPSAVVSSTIKAASLFAAGQAAATGVISVKVAALTEGVLKAMFLTKLKLATVALGIAGLLASGVLVASLCAEPAKPARALAEPAEAKPADEKKPQPAGPGTLLLAREGGLVALTPEGKAQDELNTPKDTRSTYQARLSPDGTRAVFVICEGPGRGPGDDLNAPWPFQVVIRKLGATESRVVDFPGFGVELSWAPDGKRLAVTKLDKDGPGATVLLDPETGKTEPLDLPANVQVLDWTRDGKTFLVLYRKDKKYRLGLAEKGDKEVRELTELKVRFADNALARFSPDGKKVLFTDADPEQKDAHKWHRSSNPYLLDVATKKREPLAEFPENAQCLGVAWSPDGKRVAYTWVQLHPDLLKKDVKNIDEVQIETEAFLIVADADGKNAQTVKSAKLGNAVNPIYGSIDWR